MKDTAEYGMCLYIPNRHLKEVIDYLEPFDSSILVYQSSPYSWTIEWLNNFDEFIELEDLFYKVGWLWVN